MRLEVLELKDLLGRFFEYKIPMPSLKNTWT